ncbi:hypothetical protein [Holospora curviuscula]|uniref:LTXXQ motif protein n=1 Tax=Holospora curviuscula TaxID=1082868 RepID=A0A2S5REZ2_9PROT|nr:hypothetical protein [Holospora curviuscula]PPE05705.1 hypothetical protein HCUR_00158 [Holospora curviuscula]
MYKKYLLAFLVTSFSGLFNANAVEESDKVETELQDKVQNKFFDEVKEVIGTEYSLKENRRKIEKLFSTLSSEEKKEALRTLRDLKEKVESSTNIQNEVVVDPVAKIDMMAGVKRDDFWKDFLNEYIKILEDVREKNSVENEDNIN